MRIALIGYGKMGKAIEAIALRRGHTITLKIDEHNASDLNAINMSTADVGIEFTGPHSAFKNIKTFISAGLPLVCGSTGWNSHINEVEQMVKEKKGSFIFSSNFSVGVNIFFEVNKKLAE